LTSPPAHVSLRCDLDGEVARKFQECKQVLGVSTNAELIRILTSIGHQALVKYPLAEGPLARIAPQVEGPPRPPIPRELVDLATKLEVDPMDLATDFPTILAKGGRTFGMRRLECYTNGGQVFARIWVGQRCVYSAPIPGAKEITSHE
jgi:hypothetical protein